MNAFLRRLSPLVAVALCWSLCISAIAADLTVTAANVKLVDNVSNVRRVQFGEAVTQGQALYKKAADGKYYKADADSATAEVTEAEGIAVTPGSTGEYGYVIFEGKVNIGATLTVGEIYVLSDVAGGVRPEADNGSGDTVVILGVATTTSQLWFVPFATGADVP